MEKDNDDAKTKHKKCFRCKLTTQVKSFVDASLPPTGIDDTEYLFCWVCYEAFADEWEKKPLEYKVLFVAMNPFQEKMPRVCEYCHENTLRGLEAVGLNIVKWICYKCWDDLKKRGKK